MNILLLLAAISSYGAQFERDFGVSTAGVKYDIVFEGLNNHATCYYMADEIIVNANHWVRLTKHEQKELVYHELGHCVLNLRHAKSALKPAIMRPRLYSVSWNGDNWNKLLMEMRRGE